MPWWVDVLEAAKEWQVFPEDLLEKPGVVTWLIRRREWRNAQAKRQNLVTKTR